MPNNDEAELKEASKLFEEVMKEMGAAEGGSDNPFMQACSQMFKDFEGMTKDEVSGAQGLPTGGNSDAFMSLLNNMAKDLMSGDPASSEKAMENIMGQFNEF